MAECRYCGCGTDRKMVSCIDCADEHRTEVRGLRAEAEMANTRIRILQNMHADVVADRERLRALCREAAPVLEAWADEWSYYDEDYEHGVALARRLRAAGVEPGTDGGEG